MKTSMTALASVAAILPAATANFDLYFTTVGGVGGSDRAWTLYNDPPECSEVRTGIFPSALPKITTNVLEG